VVVQRFLFHGSKLRDIVLNADAVEYGGQRYRLRAEILHIGDTQNSGHYIAVSREGSTLVEYDDRHVNILARGVVTRGDVYVLWYAREK
jgi:ubiquitin C-terminal hydrolase